jgi:hypothetical protein
MATLSDAAHDLIRREQRWLQALPLDRQVVLDEDATAERFRWNHLLASGEAAMVLVGVKPCCVVGHGEWAGPDGMGRAYYDAVMRPWFDRFAALLAPAGFTIGVTAPDVAQYMPKHPGAQFGWQAIFANENHPDGPAAATLFTQPIATNGQLQRAFGYPTAETHRSRRHTVRYVFSDGAKLFGEDLCCSPCLEYKADPRDAAAVERHFCQVRLALAGRLGIDVFLDVTCFEERPQCVIAA